MFSKLLIANRGEIAVRIIRACKEMGILTVAVFSEADRDAMHVSLADESYCIGPARAKDSYLNMGAILTVAVAAKAQAIHPGYGLLSENAAFAEMCGQCGIAFIGPDSAAIKSMGDKGEARKTMRRSGVPLTPGCDLVQSAKEAEENAAEIGYPVLLKARLGGGGKGIRLVKTQAEMERAYLLTAQEAQSAFGDREIYLEKYLSPVRHIEIQIIADHHGNILCFPERECSVQRNNQKLLEESPSQAVSETLREQMTRQARRAARALHYTGVGTVEFLLDNQGKFYFCEMNTRLQVEHPVTEMVTGIDLVKWQIRVAAGMKLPFGQQDILLGGHAVECRINAENPAKNFEPGGGKITLLHVPGGPWVRFDSAIYQGYTVPPYYDSMIGKLIVFAPTREEAIRKMRSALCELIIEGVYHNTEFLLEILSDRSFVSGDYDTGLVEKRRS